VTDRERGKSWREREEEKELKWSLPGVSDTGPGRVLAAQPNEGGKKGA